MADLSDEFIDSLDTFTSIKDRRESESDAVRASFFAHDDIFSASRENRTFVGHDGDIEPDLVFGLPPERERLQRQNAIGVKLYEEEEMDMDEVMEHGDVVSVPDHVRSLHSATSADGMGFNIKPDSFSQSQYSNCSEDTDRSFSIVSEDESPPSSPLRPPVYRRMSEGSYEQRIEATLAGAGTKSLDLALSQRQELIQGQQFRLSDLSHFDPHFGRAAFLEQIGTDFTDGSGGKSLASYRMSSLQRMTVTSSVIRQGWLVKKGEVVPSWHKRWFTLRRMMDGPMLTYAKDDAEGSPAKMVVLNSTSRCVVVTGKSSRENEFKILTTTDSSKRREICLTANSNYELTEWVCAIQAAINAGNKSAFEGAEDFEKLLNEAGIQGFVLQYGIRKCSNHNRLQTRVLELNFAEQTITNLRRGEALSMHHFNDLIEVSLSSVKSSGEEHGLIIEFSGRRRSWPIFLDTKETRDDLYALLQKIADKNVTGGDLEARYPRLVLKRGILEQKILSTDLRIIAPHATLKGRLLVCLHENCVFFYPDDADADTKPWYVLSLKGVEVSCKEEKSMLVLGRINLRCSSPVEARAWYHAVLAATYLPQEIIDIELKEREKIRLAFHSTVLRLRQLLKAKVVKIDGDRPPEDAKTIDIMLRKLWRVAFPGQAYTSGTDPRWLEIGFQRGGPGSDLRASGLLGLYALTYFASEHPRDFNRILDRTRHGVSTGNMKNYPLAIACINVAATLTTIFGFGDAGSHSEGSSVNATKTFLHFLAQKIVLTPSRSSFRRSSVSSTPLSAYNSWEDIVDSHETHVFEEIFCLTFPLLDTLFVDMGAGYMEFGQVVAAFRRRLNEIFDTLPQTMAELKAMVIEPCNDTLLEPSIVAKAGK